MSSCDALIFLGLRSGLSGRRKTTRWGDWRIRFEQYPDVFSVLIVLRSYNRSHLSNFVYAALVITLFDRIAPCLANSSREQHSSHSS